MAKWLIGRKTTNKMTGGQTMNDLRIFEPTDVLTYWRSDRLNKWHTNDVTYQRYDLPMLHLLTKWSYDGLWNLGFTFWRNKQPMERQMNRIKMERVHWWDETDCQIYRAKKRTDQRRQKIARSDDRQAISSNQRTPTAGIRSMQLPTFLRQNPRFSLFENNMGQTDGITDGRTHGRTDP